MIILYICFCHTRHVCRDTETLPYIFVLCRNIFSFRYKLYLCHRVSILFYARSNHECTGLTFLSLYLNSILTCGNYTTITNGNNCTSINNQFRTCSDIDIIGNIQSGTFLYGQRSTFTLKIYLISFCSFLCIVFINYNDLSFRDVYRGFFCRNITTCPRCTCLPRNRRISCRSKFFLVLCRYCTYRSYLVSDAINNCIFYTILYIARKRHISTRSCNGVPFRTLINLYREQNLLAICTLFSHLRI